MALNTPVGAVDLDRAGQEVAGVTLEHDLQELQPFLVQPFERTRLRSCHSAKGLARVVSDAG